MDSHARWSKKGHIFSPDTDQWWSHSYALLPTPWLRPDGTLRVYYASTDKDLIGRISYVDLDQRRPSSVTLRPTSFVLDAGEPGAFDDCGVNASCLLELSDRVLLYYVGYQRSIKVPYLLLGGVAESTDGGNTFVRVQQTPLLERTASQLTIRTAPCVVRVGSTYRMWYSGDLGWKESPSGHRVPTYGIFGLESSDPLSWSQHPRACIMPDAAEMGLGRPWVLQTESGFEAWFSVRRMAEDGRLTYVAIESAVSSDGWTWRRRHTTGALYPGPAQWESGMVCYPAVLTISGKRCMFYNGDGNGRTGFGLAEYES